MILSPELTRYITTGHCPHCDVVILSADYMRRYSADLKDVADRLAYMQLPPKDPLTGRLVFGPSLWPDGAKVRFRLRRREMQCETCWRTWPLRPPPGSRTSAATRLPSATPDRVDYLRRRRQGLEHPALNPSSQ